MDQKKGAIVLTLIFGLIFSISLISSLSIGIVRTSGTPQIISCEAPSSDVFDTANIDVKVKNVGEGTGNFRFSYQCGNQEIDYPMMSHRVFSSGEEKTETIPVYSEELGAQICHIYVSDANNYYEDEVSCQFTITKKECEYCYQEGIVCNNERGYLEKCANNNCEKEIVEYCSEGCAWNKYDYKYSCKENIPKPNYVPYIIIPLIIIMVISWIVIKNRKKSK